MSRRHARELPRAGVCASGSISVCVCVCVRLRMCVRGLPVAEQLPKTFAASLLLLKHAALAQWAKKDI